jgi:hypothetical protein
MPHALTTCLAVSYLFASLLSPVWATENNKATQGSNPNPTSHLGALFGPSLHLEKLSEADRKRVRTALDQAFKDPEVEASRERWRKAGDELKSKLRRSLQNIDPEVVKLLEAARPPLPKPEDPDFTSKIIDRLISDLQQTVKAEHREELRVMHQKILGDPQIAAAVTKLNTLPVAERIAAARALAANYRRLLEPQLTALRQREASRK